MYVTQRDACSVPNSLTPVSSSQIALSQAFLDAYNNLIGSAQKGFTDLINRADLNAAGQPVQQTTVAPFDNAPPPKANVVRLEEWPTMCVGNGAPVLVPTPVGCGSSAPILPPPMPALTIPPVGVAQPMDKPAGPPPSFPTTGNPCIDLAKGYVVQSQLTPEMLYQCSQKGYYAMGSKRPAQLTDEQITYQIMHAANLPKLPDKDVPVYDASMGLAGVTGEGSGILWGSLGLAAAVAWLGWEYSKKGKR